jgi:hypothetical protein
VELADLHVSHFQQGREATGDLYEVKMTEAQVRKAFWDADAAFMELAGAFPKNKTMKRHLLPRTNVNEYAVSPQGFPRCD